MGLPPISAIRGDGLSDPRRTGSITATHFEVATVAAMPGQRQGQRRQQHEQELPYEDAEFVQIIEVSEPEFAAETGIAEASPAPRGRFHAIA